MPKVVDHQQRRRELVEATWRIIARRGSAGATMREIAAEAGFANGALKPYFPTKAQLIQATYEFVFDRTNRRVTAATCGLTGLAALEVFCREVLPLDEERRDEARVVTVFWGEAAHDPEGAALHARSMAQWRESLAEWLRQGRDDGDLHGSIDVVTAGDVLLNFMLGAQISVVLDQAATSGEALDGQLADQLERLGALSQP